MNIKRALETIEATKDRSAWNKGVNIYAYELLEEYMFNYGENAAAPTKTDLLNGADDWHQYSYGGSALIYDCDIAERLCSPSELKKTRNGERNPNSRESWLDVQARALYQACNRVLKVCRMIERQEVKEV